MNYTFVGDHESLRTRGVWSPIVSLSSAQAIVLNSANLAPVPVPSRTDIHKTTTYTIAAGDNGARIVLSHGASAKTLTLPASPASMFNVEIQFGPGASAEVRIDPGRGTENFITGVALSKGVRSIAVTAGGTGYGTPTVVFTGGGGSGAAGTATVVEGVITAVVITDRGIGYTSAPAISFDDGEGDGADAVAVATIGYVPAPDTIDQATSRAGYYWTGSAWVKF